jgi:hypothetical protein
MRVDDLVVLSGIYRSPRHRMTRNTRLQMSNDDVAGNICQALPDGIGAGGLERHLLRLLVRHILAVRRCGGRGALRHQAGPYPHSRGSLI